MHKFPTRKFVRIAKRSSRHGSELEQDGRFYYQDVSILEPPSAAGLATGHGQIRGQAISWAGESTQLQCASIRLGNRRTVHLLVERLGETGWDWHVWVRAGWTWARYGLAETAEHAKKQAERALVGLMRSDAGGTALLAANQQSILLPQRGA